MRIFDLPADEPASGPEFGLGPDHKFICKPTMPAGAMVNLFYAAQAEDKTRQAAGFVGVIGSALEGDDFERFNDLIYGSDINIPLETLGEIARWLVEEYSKPRPSTPSSGSRGGSTRTRATPKDGSSETASA
ncbi:MAG TPA: hypothetical protein VI916_02640 [Acidimicrobiia bacterium]|nr:hypothetical protein [Acidimicrobiia bacterium]